MIDLPERRARGFSLASGQRIIAFRAGKRVVAYRDSCPHEPGTQLCWKRDEYMDSAGLHLVCAAHGALFRPSDGHCELGPCVGLSLDPVEVAVEGGQVFAVER